MIRDARALVTTCKSVLTEPRNTQRVRQKTDSRVEHSQRATSGSLLAASALFLRTDCTNARCVTRYITPRNVGQYPPLGQNKSCISDLDWTIRRFVNDHQGPSPSTSYGYPQLCSTVFYLSYYKIYLSISTCGNCTSLLST